MPNFDEEYKINHLGYENNLAPVSAFDAAAGWLQHLIQNRSDTG